jgi:hypothetical protein
MHKTAAPIHEALFLRPIKYSRIRDKTQCREHRHRTNKVVHVAVLAGSVQCHKVLWRRIYLCLVYCTDFTTSLNKISHFGSCYRLFTKQRTYTLCCDWGFGRLYPVDETNPYKINPSCYTIKFILLTYF